MLPLLTLAADACGVFMGWVNADSGCPGFAAPVYHSAQRASSNTCSADIQDRRVRPHLSADACFQGMRRAAGAEGVGRAQQSVSFLIVFGRCGLVKFILVFFP